MYSHCLFCRADLGRNEVIEPFPVGRRLAFDAAKGRLWVVCLQCGQWNLTPFEERWEAVESAERLFSDAKRRVSGDEIGLAHLREGLALVRIGRPQRPEFAAWRYGDQFGRRRREAMVLLAGSAVAGGALLAGGLATGIFTGGFMSLLSLIISASTTRTAARPILLPQEDGSRLLLTAAMRETARLVERSASDGGWGIDVQYHGILHEGDRLPERRLDPWRPPQGTAHLSGRNAVLAAERLMSKSLARAIGTRRKHVDGAVRFIEDAGGPEKWFEVAARSVRKWAPDQISGPTGGINHLPPQARLALEMAAHEESERRALEGELAELEDRWRDAEEVAAIADDLFLPSTVGRTLARLKARAGEAGV